MYMTARILLNPRDVFGETGNVPRDWACDTDVRFNCGVLKERKPAKDNIKKGGDGNYKKLLIRNI